MNPDPTTDPGLRSFVPVASDSHFPIQNLPYGVFARRAGGEPRVGVAVGDFVLDLTALGEKGVFGGPALRGRRPFASPPLNAFLALGRAAWAEALHGQPAAPRRRADPARQLRFT